MSYDSVSRGGPGYPSLLAELHDPPSRLHLRGGPAEILSRPAVAVVGARSCSAYGAQVARDLARELAAAGVVVVSGLARTEQLYCRPGHAQDEVALRREEALQGHRHRQGAGPPLLLEPHPREEVAQAQAPHARWTIKLVKGDARRATTAAERATADDPRQAFSPRPKKRREVLERTKGFRGEANSSYKRAKEAMMKADAYAYRDRRNRKRDFRRLWITRINAAARAEGMSYGTFIHGLAAGRRRAGPQGPGRHRRARPRDLPPIRRARPRGLGGLANLAHRRAFSGRPSHPERRPFLFHDRNHQPPQRSRSRRSASSPEGAGATSWASSWPRARTCWRRPTPPAGTRPRATRRPGSGLDGRPGRAARAGRRSPSSGSGTRAIGVYPQRWSPPVGPRCVALWGVGDPGNVGTVIRSALAFGASLRRARPGQRRSRTATRPCAPRWARCSPSPSRACATSPSCRAGEIALVAREGEPLHAPRRRRRHARRRRRARRPARRRRRRVRRRRPHPDRPRRLARTPPWRPPSPSTS